jgi:CHAT domain-containing protein
MKTLTQNLMLVLRRWLSFPVKYLLLGLFSCGLILFATPVRAIDSLLLDNTSNPATTTLTEVPSNTPSATTSSPLQQGRTLYAAGRFTEALMVWQQAVQDYAASGDRLSQALSLSYLSLTYQELNQWEAASTAITQSLDILRNPATGAESILLAQALNTQASLLLSMGQAETALSTWQEAQKFYEQAGDVQGTLGSQINQAQALRSLGFYRRSKQVLEDVNGQLSAMTDSTLKVSALRDLGTTLQVIGDLPASQAVLLEGLAIAENINATTELSSILLSLGKVMVNLNNISDALYYFQQAEQTAVTPLEKLQARLTQVNLYVEYVDVISAEQWHPITALAYATYQQLAEMPAGRHAIYGAVNLVANLSKLSEQQQPIPTVKLAELLASAVQSARNLNDLRAEAYALNQWGQLYVQNQQWAEALRLTQQALNIANQLQASDISSQSAWQLGRILNQQGRTEPAVNAYTEAVNALKSLRGDLVAINPDVQFSYRESVEPVYRELVDLLLTDHPSEAALIQARDLIESLQIAELDNFFREACLDAQPQQIDQVDANATVMYPILLPDRIAVITSTPGHPLHYHATSGTKADTEDTLRQLLAAVHPVSDNAKRLQLSQQVYDWLIRPMEADGDLAQTKTLVFVLDGLLRNIPLAALHDGERYLVEKYAVALSPGLQLMQGRSLDQSNLRAIIGGISESRNGFSALPAVETEVNHIGQMVSATPLLNQSFTSDALIERLENDEANVVHFATHGQFSSKLEDTFLLTWDGRVNVRELSEILRGRENNQTGVIDLLVLSACDTAAGDDRATLGLAGLAVKSGARSTLATLWPVKDKAAELLMTQFYQHLQEPGITKVEALRRAQVAVLTQTDYVHPFFWSSFVLVGNWL